MIIERHIARNPSILETLRQRLYITQSIFAELSGIFLLMIQANRAWRLGHTQNQGTDDFALSKALECKVEMIV